MHDWRRYVRSHLPRLAVAAERETEIVDELALQLEATYERALSAGATIDEARLKAEAEVPDWAALARTLGKIERPDVAAPAAGAQYGGFMTGFSQDIRYALRALARAPGFAMVSIVTLALGIGATTIVYSLVDGVLLRPLPIHEPDRVVLVREFNKGREDGISWMNFQDWRARATSFEQLAAWRAFISNLTGIDQPRRLQSSQVTANLFSVLGVRPVLGRDFTAEDDKPGGQPVARRKWRCAARSARPDGASQGRC